MVRVATARGAVVVVTTALLRDVDRLGRTDVLGLAATEVRCGEGGTIDDCGVVGDAGESLELAGPTDAGCAGLHAASSRLAALTAAATP